MTATDSRRGRCGCSRSACWTNSAGDSSLESDAGNGTPLEPLRSYRYRIDGGPEVIDGVAEGTLIFSGASLLSLAREELGDERSLADARRLLRAALDQCLEGRPLRTREVLIAMRAHGGGAERLKHAHPSHCRLGVNIDHVATLRQVRRATYPGSRSLPRWSPSSRAPTASRCTCARIAGTSRTATSRAAAALQTRMNLEMAATDAMLASRAACARRTAASCRRSARRSPPKAGSTSPGSSTACVTACAALRESGIRVSLFIEPDLAQIEAAHAAGAPVVELHTGAYADATGRAAGASS